MSADGAEGAEGVEGAEGGGESTHRKELLLDGFERKVPDLEGIEGSGGWVCWVEAKAALGRNRGEETVRHSLTSG